MKTVTLACLLAAIPVSAVYADGVSVSLNASAVREVANDEFQAQLYTQHQGPTAAALAGELNRTLNRALAVARRYNDVDTRSGGYNSWPQYDKNGKIVGWSGRANLWLKSRNLTQASELTAQLQGFMLLDNASFQLSTQARRDAQRELIPEAIADLKAQAAIAAKALGKQSVSVRELSINSPMAPVQMRAMSFKAAAPAAADAAPNVNWQPGNSQLQVEVSGKAELE